MSLATVPLDEGMLAYLACMTPDEHPALAGLHAETLGLEDAAMQSSPAQMRLIGLLLQASGAKNILEVGCFTGYGALAMALAARDGKVTTLDLNDQWADIGKNYWRQAGVEERIHWVGGLAAQSMRQLHNQGETFDFIYIDADKKSYPAYLDEALKLLRPGGLMALDNMLWGGAVADPSDDSRQVSALREVASRIRDDKRLTSCLLPIADGLMLARLEDRP